MSHEVSSLVVGYITDVCRSCVAFHVVRSFDTSDARSAQAVSTANCFCYSHKRTLSRRALQCEMRTWGLHWCATSWCRVHRTKYGCHNWSNKNCRGYFPCYCCIRIKGCSSLHLTYVTWCICILKRYDIKWFPYCRFTPSTYTAINHYRQKTMTC